MTQQLYQVLSDVVLVSQGKELEVLASAVDLDYWNVRQWRRIFTLYSLANEKQDCELKICPTNYRPF